MYATSDVEDALNATRGFLLPFDWSRWWRLAVVALFLGGGATVNPPSVEVPVGGPEQPRPMPGEISDPRSVVEGLHGDLFYVAAALAVLAVLLGLLFAIVGAVMQFVMVESLRQERVTVRRYFGRRWRQGVRLFVFNLALGLLTLLVVGGLVGVGLVPLTLTDSTLLAVLALVVVVPLILAFTLLAAVAFVFTTSFVVPTMVVEDCGVLDGWRRFWPVMRESWKEYLAYAVVYVALQIVAGIAAGIAIGLGIVALLIPFAILGVLAGALVAVAGPVGIVALFLVGLLFAAAVVVLVAFVKVPIATFMRYYALFLLGDTDESLDLVADRRATVRSGE